MKQNFKRFLSIVLTCVMLFGMLPVSAFAAEADETTPVVETPIVVETTAPETTAPETTVPETTVPETTAPETTVPETTVPETTVPETTVPETTVPETTVPETTVPETTVPETTVPETTVPETTVPETTVPETTVPETTVPEDTVPEETTEEVSVAEGYLQQINALKAQADALGGNGPECADIYNSLMKINDQVIADKESGVITDEEYNEIYNAIGSVMMVLFGYGYDPYAVATVADTPQMKYYNDTNKVAYDVAESDYRGYNDYTGKYVQSVTLGGKTVTQANSNGSYTESSVDDRVGQALSVYYPNVDTNDAEAEATLAITPAPGYYVSKIVVACCDVNVAYNCGTWSAGKVFTKSFDVSTGGTLTTTLPTSAFGHGTSSNHYSTNGKAQYFILIRVASVPEPLYVAYEYGSIGTIMGSDLASSPFANTNEWVSASTANNYGTGGANQTPYTQFKYAYAANSEVANWKHVTDTVTQEAKLAAAEKGYYFTGWKATYYSNCTSRYVFSNVYSEATGLIGENQDLRLVTHVKLVAQWAPVKLNVKKVVTGLPTAQSYTINLLKNGAASETITFNGAGTKSYSPIAAGTYAVTEEGANQRVTIGNKEYFLTTTYSDPVALTAENIASGALREATLTVTNAYKEIEKTSVTVTKEWDDADNQDGIRPASITVHLFADGKEVGSATLNVENGWTYTFSNLDKYDGDQEIAYTVTEDAVEGYTVSVDGHLITNTHTPEKTSVMVTKVWDDENNLAGFRTDSVTVQLKANGAAQGDAVVLNAGNNWTNTWNDLDKFAGGKEIVYTVEEINVPSYYTAAVSGDSANGFTITNTHTPERIDLSVEKKWDDEDDRDGIRPETITVKLLANGAEVATAQITADNDWKYTFEGFVKYANGQEIKYTVKEVDSGDYEDTYDGLTITNKYTPKRITVSGSKIWDDNDNQDGKRPESITINLMVGDTKKDSKTVTADDDWKWSFTDLYQYENGAEIQYTITEDAVTDYESKVDGYNVTNTHKIETTKVEGVKTWDDAGNQDNKRPASITINLYGDEELVESKTVTPDENGNWAWSFENLPVYKAGEVGQKIVYTITEDEVAGYESKVEGYNVTNTHKVDLTEVTVTKVWDDADNQDGIRPASVTVQLKADGKAFGDPVVLSSSNEWTHIFTDLEVNKKGQVGVAIDYTVEELNVPTDYTAEVSGSQANGYTITNIHEVYKTEVSVSKVWDDADDQDGLRPESVTVMLYADNNPASEPVVLSEANGWTYTFKDLDEKAEGRVIGYTVEEMKVPADYTVAVTGSHEEGYTITNTHIPETTAVEGKKTWIDDEDRDGLRPESITINLVADGEIIETVEVTEKDGWAWSFEQLPVYRDHGTKIVYEITEEAVDGYTTVIEGFNVTNTHEIATTEVKGAKTWDDANNQDGKRPASITINLLADGEIIETIEVTEAEGWAWGFTELPVYKDHGVEIVYAITENAVEGYATTYDGYNVINSYTPEETSVTVTKAWADSNNAEGIRPGSVTIRLMANGVFTGLTLELDAQSKWVGSFTGLPKYFEGELVEYTVDEVAVKGYTTVIKGNMEEGFTVTNTHVYIPQTGDDRTPMMWITMMAVSAMMIALASIDSKKRRNATK